MCGMQSPNYSMVTTPCNSEAPKPPAPSSTSQSTADEGDDPVRDGLAPTPLKGRRRDKLASQGFGPISILIAVGLLSTPLPWADIANASMPSSFSAWANVQILGSSNLGSESVDEYIGALDCGQRFFGMPQRGLHIAGLSDASAPSDNQDSKSREGDEHCGPCQPFRIFGHTFVGASAPAARGAFWGAIWGLGALIVIFWIDYLDRRSYRKNRDGQQRTQYDFGNAKPPQNKTPSLTKFPPV
jgi:hypothetical protein